MNGSAPCELRIARKFPCTNWKRVSKNLHASAAPEAIKSTWYTSLHDLKPTDRLAAINLSDTPACSSCGHFDSLQNRITECGKVPIIWTWTNETFRRNTSYGPQIHPAGLDPSLRLLALVPQKQAEILWILAHLVQYRLHTHRRLSLLDYMDFLRRSRWKLYHQVLRPL